MYQTMSQIPEEELKEIREAGRSWGVILSEPCSYDFEKVVCRNGKRTFTKENLIEELSKIDAFPDYTFLFDVRRNIHLVPFGKEISDAQVSEMYDIFKNVFGILEYE